MNCISECNVPRAYVEAFWKMRVWAEEEETRNGLAMVVNDVFLTIHRPWERLLVDEVRRPNPFFHMMEFIWMMSGSNDVTWITQFNTRMRQYAESDGRVHGAYGHRWRHHFGVNQIAEVCDLLKSNPNTRRAVLGMWDPCADLNADYADIPCNTHIYVTRTKEGLEFTVCNRSNDLVWGMLGANCVHMTMLQQIIAEELGVPMGFYKVFTKNLHVYKSLPRFETIWKTTCTHDIYGEMGYEAEPILGSTSIRQFMTECQDFILGLPVKNLWLEKVATPMRDAYLDRIAGGKGIKEIYEIDARDWQRAAMIYVEQKEVINVKRA